MSWMNPALALLSNDELAMRAALSTHDSELWRSLIEELERRCEPEEADILYENAREIRQMLGIKIKHYLPRSARSGS